MEDKDFLLTIHYYLKGNGKHEIDAYTHNSCEAILLKAIRELKRQTKADDAQILLCVSEEGGFIDKLKGISSNQAFLVFLGALLSHWYSPAVTDNEDTKTAIETAEKIKNGQYTEEEANALVAGNKKLKNFVSAYYKNLRHNPEVEKVEYQLTTENDVSKGSIEQKDFESHILPDKEDVKEILSTTIVIVSPVLFDDEKTLWRGEYNGDHISFSMKDNDFWSDVANRKVKFDSGTTISCDLTIITKEENPNKKYIVSKVHSWADGEHFKQGDRIYKKRGKTSKRSDT